MQYLSQSYNVIYLHYQYFGIKKLVSSFFNSLKIEFMILFDSFKSDNLDVMKNKQVAPSS
jgi:hypothetical protein